MDRFIIVSKARSGTNHIVQLLNSHPRIACFGEIFRSGYRVTNLIDAALGEFEPIEARVERPDAFLDAIENRVAEHADAMGFKVFPNQFRPVSGIVNRPGVKIVRLVRHNLLATYSSGKIANETGQGVAKTGQEIRRATVEFVPDEFRSFLKRQVRQDGHVNESLSVLPGDRFFDLAYTQLGDTATLDALQRFLGVEPSALVSKMQKRNPSNILDRFSNPEDARAFLDAEGKMEWAEEG